MARKTTHKPDVEDTPVTRTLEVSGPESAPEKPADPRDALPDIRGFEKRLWSGIPMYKCRKCGTASMFKRQEALEHKCPVVRRVNSRGEPI